MQKYYAPVAHVTFVYGLPNDHTLLACLLRASGSRRRLVVVAEASDGVGGLRTVRLLKPDVLLLDDPPSGQDRNEVARCGRSGQVRLEQRLRLLPKLRGSVRCLLIELYGDQFLKESRVSDAALKLVLDGANLSLHLVPEAHHLGIHVFLNLT